MIDYVSAPVFGADTYNLDAYASARFLRRSLVMSPFYGRDCKFLSYSSGLNFKFSPRVAPECILYTIRCFRS